MEPFKYTTCGICGKQFIKQPGSIYKLIFAGKTYHFCCYTCYQHALRTKEGEKGNEARYKS